MPDVLVILIHSDEFAHGGTPDFEPREVWGADREGLMRLFENADRTDPGVKKFKSVATMWPQGINAT